MRLLQVGGRPLHRMIGMRVVKTNDVEALVSHISLDSDKVQRGNAVAVARRIVAGIGASDHASNGIRISKMAEQDATALVGIRLFGVATKSGVAGGINS